MNYFKIEEFASSDNPNSGGLMNNGFLRALINARELAKTSFVITSGYRTIKHNREINGNPSSSHLKGLAADIACDNGPKREKIVRGLILAGFTRIGIGSNFIHCDTDNDKPNSIWLY